MNVVRSAAPRLAPGFTLVELCVVLAVAGLLAAAAWPSYQSQLQRARRADAVTALLRVQAAQESYRAHHGLYAAQLQALVGASASRSREGWYDLQLDGSGDRYEARAVARADDAAAGDRACATLRLRVYEGIADFAPSARCWNR
jgi:type IV pilus assembly protein PilE